jgi:hypothetical protein
MHSAVRMLTALAIATLPTAASAQEPRTKATNVPWASPNLQLQTWATVWDQDEDPQADPGGYGDPEHDPGFSIPRARLGFTAGYRWVDMGVRVGTSRPYDTISPGDTRVDLVEAWGRLSFDSRAGTTRFTFGQHHVPFSREMRMSSNDLVFQERAVSSNWLAPNRDLGATVLHEYKWVALSVGVYNGGGGLLGDVDQGVQIGTRLDFSIGGDTFRTNSSHDAFGIGAGYLYNDTAVTTEHRINVDLLGRIKGFTVHVEAGMNILDPDDVNVILPPDVPEQTTRWGGFAQLSYYRELGLGAIEPAVRFSYFDDARHLSDNGEVGVLHGGITWREPVPFFDVGLGYIHRMEFAGRSVNNDTVRIWFGLKFPSRRYRPANLFKLLDAGKGKGKKKG